MDAEIRRRYVILAEGLFGEPGSKTAMGVIKYGRDPVVAIIDSTRAGRDVAEWMGPEHAAPVVATLADSLAYGPTALLIGTAPKGGRIPPDWRATLVAAIENGLDVISGLHEFVSEDLDAISMHGALIETGDNASVKYVSLQRYGRGVKHFSIQHATARRDSRTGVFNIQLGADLARADVSSHLLGQGCDGQMLALWLGDESQHFDHHTLQHHVEPHCGSDLLFKGALAGSASSVFRGLIRVAKGAQLTDAYQTNRNLLLSEKAKAVTLPSLEIEADDVRCSHGATIGQVDDSQLFYLMSRGLTREQAERLLVLGFFEEVLGRLPMAGVRARVLEAIEAKTAL